MSAQPDITTEPAAPVDESCPESSPSLRAWDEEPTLAWVGLHTAHRRLLRCLEQDLVSRHGVGLSGYKLLARLVKSSGEVRMSELADDALLSPSRVSRLADQLEADGHLERTTCPTDSRGVCAVLTPGGREFLAQVHATYVETVEREFFDRLGERDVKALARAFSRLS
ncbi:MAG: MarR family transcriptional regulator [Thermoleophilaceae bacterium]